MKLLMPSLALYKPKKSLEIKSKSQRSSVGCVNTYRLITDFYSYDAIARPTTRQINERADTFAYNAKSELTAAQLGSDNYGYAYDNIGNRKTAQEIAEEITYSTNSTNEYTAINDFTSEFDTDVNQTRLQTSTGIWTVEYNAENRPTKFTSMDGSTIVECAYDYMGRRAWKKVIENGVITYHQAFIYRGYLQIAAENLIEGKRWAMHFITWDPTQPTATRPLAIEQNGTWYTYGLDLSKNITELYTTEGTIASTYTYSPFGAVTQTGDVGSPVQWSSEVYDEELGLVYYNYRSCNPADGRWINRDPIAEEGGFNLYGFVGNRVWMWDELGHYEWFDDLWNASSDFIDAAAEVAEQVFRPSNHGYTYSGSFMGPCGPDIIGQELIEIFKAFKNDYKGASRKYVQKYTASGGTCVNDTEHPISVLVDGKWETLQPRSSTDAFTDCDGIVCCGKFYGIKGHRFIGGKATCHTSGHIVRNSDQLVQPAWDGSAYEGSPVSRGASTNDYPRLPQ